MLPEADIRSGSSPASCGTPPISAKVFAISSAMASKEPCRRPTSSSGGAADTPPAVSTGASREISSWIKFTSAHNRCKSSGHSSTASARKAATISSTVKSGAKSNCRTSSDAKSTASLATSKVAAIRNGGFPNVDAAKVRTWFHGSCSISSPLLSKSSLARAAIAKPPSLECMCEDPRSNHSVKASLVICRWSPRSKSSSRTVPIWTSSSRHACSAEGTHSMSR